MISLRGNVIGSYASTIVIGSAPAKALILIERIVLVIFFQLIAIKECQSIKLFQPSLLAINVILVAAPVVLKFLGELTDGIVLIVKFDMGLFQSGVDLRQVVIHFVAVLGFNAIAVPDFCPAGQCIK